ncbi:Caudovirales tail fiber assembly protein [compost metagenome]
MKTSGIFKHYDAASHWGGLSNKQIEALSGEASLLHHIATTTSGALFLRDEHGHDWYLWQKALSDNTLKVAYNPADGLVSHTAFDASALVPDNLAVAEIVADKVPAGYDHPGTVLRFAGGVLSIVPPDPVVQARARLAQLQLEADRVIAALARAVTHGMATDPEKARLGAWEKYTVLLSRVDPRTPEYPQKPE